MNDEELLDNNEMNDEEVSSEFNSEEISSAEEDHISDEQIINAIREIINEDDIERSSVSGNSIYPEDNLSSNEVVDYTQLLTDIKNQNIEISSKLTTIIEDNNKTIFDKEINEYSVQDTVLIAVVIFGVIFIVLSFIKKFTPKIWR